QHRSVNRSRDYGNLAQWSKFVAIADGGQETARILQHGQPFALCPAAAVQVELVRLIDQLKGARIGRVLLEIDGDLSFDLSKEIALGESRTRMAKAGDADAVLFLDLLAAEEAAHLMHQAPKLLRIAGVEAQAGDFGIGGGDFGQLERAVVDEHDVGGANI